MTFSSKEAALRLKISPQRVRLLAAQHFIGGKVSGVWVFTGKDLREMRGIRLPNGQHRKPTPLDKLLRDC